MITGFKEKWANFKGKAFLVVIPENKLKVTIETTTDTPAWSPKRRTLREDSKLNIVLIRTWLEADSLDSPEN